MGQLRPGNPSEPDMHDSLTQCERLFEYKFNYALC